MTDGAYFKVRNLNKYQHYNKPNPPWVKLYQSFLWDEDIARLTDGAKFFAMALVLLSSRGKSKIPADAYWLSKVTNSESPGKVLHYLSQLQTIGFIELTGKVYNDSRASLEQVYSDAIPETETENIVCSSEQTKNILVEEPAVPPPVSPRKATKPKALLEQSKRLFAFWSWVCEKPKARLTKDRLAKIQARLSEGYTEDDIQRAIIGCTQDPFNRGENESGKEYLDLTLICRNGSKLESYRDRCQGGAYAKAIQQFNAERSPLTERISEPPNGSPH